MLNSLLLDLRSAVRSLRHSPVFTAVAILSLALGIGANTAIFSFVNAILLKTLPVPAPERLVRVTETESGARLTEYFSYPFLEQLDKQRQIFTGVFGFFPVRANLTGEFAGEPLNGEIVSGAYFRTLGVQPALGRLLTDADVNSAPADPVCVLSYSAWQNRFHSDPRILERPISLNKRRYRVIGVTASGFHGAQTQSDIEVEIPLSLMSDFMSGFSIDWRSPNFSWLEPVARLRPGITQARAQAMLQPAASGIVQQLAPALNRKPSGPPPSFRLVQASQGINKVRERIGRPLAVLMGIAGVILLIACTNLANLLLAKAKAREKEFAVRLSIGAGRLRLVRQLLVESLVLATAGGVAGVTLALWINRLLLLYFNEARSSDDLLNVSIDPVVLAFSVALSIATALLFGLAPAWQSTRTDVLPALRRASSTATAGRSRALVRKTFIVLQLALSVALLFAAGLLSVTLSRLQTVHLGFDPAQVVALSVNPSMAGYRAEAAVDQVFLDILDRLHASPGVSAASYSVLTPLEGSSLTFDVAVPGHARPENDHVNFNAVSPGYFATLAQPLLAGRDFTRHDTLAAPGVVIINRQFAAEYFSGANPIGRTFKTNDEDVTIVGLAGNALYHDLRESSQPTVYRPAAQTRSSGYTLLVQTRGNPSSAIHDIEAAIRAVNPKLPVFDVRTLRAQIDRGISSERILGFLSTLFAGLATVLCAVGLYGIVSYTVAARTREVGIRFALGAARSAVFSLFLREALLLVAAGALAGIPIALVSAQFLKAILFGVEPADPLTLLRILGILTGAALLASVVPVRRAAGIQPTEALRHE